MIKQMSLVEDLAAIAGAANVSPGQEAAGFTVDEAAPRARVSPSNYEQAGEILAYAGVNRLAVIPWGGGSMMHIGNVPRRYDIALSLSGCDRIVEHEPADLTVTCQAGLPLRTLQAHLAKSGQVLPVGPFPSPRATIGGILALNASTASRYANGTPRDFTIGMRVITADGKVTRAGGRVVKNVAGYDMCKLYVGSMGTLGVIVEATFKVALLPETERLISLRCSEAGAACSLAQEVHRRGLSVHAIELSDQRLISGRRPHGGDYVLALDVAGSDRAVERSAKEIADLAPAFRAAPISGLEAKTREPSWIISAFPNSTVLSCKASVLPDRLPALVAELGVGALSPAPSFIAWPTIGILRAAWPGSPDVEALISSVRGAVSRLSGSLVIEHCPAEIKARVDVLGDELPSFALMRRVKEQFDPNGILSPGRFVGRL